MRQLEPWLPGVAGLGCRGGAGSVPAEAAGAGAQEAAGSAAGLEGGCLMRSALRPILLRRIILPDTFCLLLTPCLRWLVGYHPPPTATPPQALIDTPHPETLRAPRQPPLVFLFVDRVIVPASYRTSLSVPSLSDMHHVRCMAPPESMHISGHRVRVSYISVLSYGYLWRHRRADHIGNSQDSALSDFRTTVHTVYMYIYICSLSRECAEWSSTSRFVVSARVSRSGYTVKKLFNVFY